MGEVLFFSLTWCLLSCEGFSGVLDTMWFNDHTIPWLKHLWPVCGGCLVTENDSLPFGTSTLNQV